MSNIDIKCGDAINLFKNIPDGSVSLIVADPSVQSWERLWK